MKRRGKAIERRAKVTRRVAAAKAGRARAAGPSAAPDLQRELNAALAQFAATSEVLQVISRSPGELRPVFRLILKNATRICEAKFGNLWLREGDKFRIVAIYGASREYRDYQFKKPLVAPDPRSAMGRVARSGEAVQIEDISKAPTHGMRARIATIKIAKARTLVGVPMLKDSEVIGIIGIYRQEVRPFTDKQIALLTNFAAQAVIAIENARLLTELRESLEQQTAAADVLRVISSTPGELEPVFHAMLESATRICEAKFGLLFRYDGEMLEFAADMGTSPALAEFLRTRGPFRPSPDTLLARVIRTKKVSETRDYAADAPNSPPVKFGGARSTLDVPLLKDGDLVGALSIYRQEVRPFTDKQIALVENFAAQAVIAIENARLLTELRESLAQQTATADVLKVIPSSPGALDRVFASLLENATRLCGANYGNMWLSEGNAFRSVAFHGILPPAYMQRFSVGAVVPSDPALPIVRAASTKQPVQFADIRKSRPYLDGHPLAVSAVDQGGILAILAVPMVKNNDAIGAIAIYSTEARQFADKQVELVKNFAAQAVIAIENARLLSELRQRTADLTESLEQQTATSEVLQVISSSPGELKSVFETMLAEAVRICGAKFGNIFRRDNEGMHLVAMRDTPAAFAEFRRHSPDTRLIPETFLGRMSATKAVVHVADIAADRGYIERVSEIVAAVELGGVRTLLAVPMLKENELVGAFSLLRQEICPFTDKQIKLVQNFADQAVIAIENARLLNELRQRTDDLTESLEQQTATSEVLSVISRSPGDLNPVFESVLQNAIRLCGAAFGNLLLREDERHFRFVGLHNAPPALAELYTREPVIELGPEAPLLRAATTKLPVQVRDFTDEPIYKRGHAAAIALGDLGGARTFVVVPLLKENEVIGGIAIYRQEVRPFTDKQIALVTSFASQAVIAIENARLLNELRQRTDELGRSVGELRALGETSQAVNSTLDLQTVLATIVAKAVQLSGTDAGAIYVFDEERREFRLRATYSMDQELIDALGRQHIRLGEANLLPGAARGQPVQVADMREEPQTELGDIILRAGYRARLIAPLIRGDDVVGILVVRRKTPGAFPQTTVDLMKTFAAQSALAIQNARLFHEIEEKGRELEVASRHKSQFLANMSHELRTPLNAILGYTELIIDSIYGDPPEKMREVLERVQTNGRHLLGLINDVLDLSKIEAGQLTLSLADYSLASLVQGVFAAVEPLAAQKNLSLRTKIAPSLPEGRGDERRLSQVLLNLVGNAIKFTDKGEVAIEASLSDGSFRVAVRDSGPGIAAADQVKIFEEFQQVDNTLTKQKGGTGLGLAISKRIVEMHGGGISVESQLGKGSTFTIKLPVTAGGEGQAA